MPREEVETRCEKTATGKHIWAKLGGNDPRIASYLICMACGLIDDRKETK